MNFSFLKDKNQLLKVHIIKDLKMINDPEVKKTIELVYHTPLPFYNLGFYRHSKSDLKYDVN